MLDYSSLSGQASNLRKQRAQSEFGEIPQSIPFLEKKLDEATTIDERAMVYSLLVSECARFGQREIEVHYLRKQLAAFPPDPLLLTALATALAKVMGSEREALSRCREAVDLARKQDRLVRASLTSQVRVALEVEDYQTLNAALQGLVEDAPNSRDVDFRYEFDFISQIDENLIDKAVLERYKVLK